MSSIYVLFQVSEWLWLAFWVLWLVWGAVTTRQRRVVSRGGSMVPVWVIIIAALLWRRGLSGYLLYLPMSALWPGHPVTVVAGFLIQLLGLAFTVWARYYLGNLWSGGIVLREGHKVVDTGPYRLVRHPIYSGILLAMLGSFLMDGTVFWLAVLVLSVIALLWKAGAEERLLTRELGEEYVNYRRRSRMLIPWVL